MAELSHEKEPPSSPSPPKFDAGELTAAFLSVAGIYSTQMSISRFRAKPTVGGVSLAEAPAFKKAPGGAPANVAVGISKLGGSSAFIGKVGADEFGYMLAEILKQNKADTSGMQYDSNARTALTFVTLRADGEHEFLFFRNPNADMLLDKSELDRNLIEKEGKISRPELIQKVRQIARDELLISVIKSYRAKFCMRWNLELWYLKARYQVETPFHLFMHFEFASKIWKTQLCGCSVKFKVEWESCCKSQSKVDI
ncbi:fructokinase [Trifolium repens]|nr:fructokinase [Trifolium repens]